MNKFPYIILVLFSVAMTIDSCKKKPNEPDSDIIEFKGITATDEYGNYMGVYDSTDWQLDDNWQRKEKQLFSDFDMYNYSCTIDSNISIAGYPNPTHGVVFYLHLDKDPTTRIDFRVVNQKFETLISADSIYSDQVSLLFEDIINEYDTIIRIYYRFVTISDCGFIGHGDIQVK